MKRRRRSTWLRRVDRGLWWLTAVPASLVGREKPIYIFTCKAREDEIGVLTKELSALTGLIYFLTIEAS
jgi:hypothetical protein